MEIALKCGYTATTHYQKNGIYLVQILRGHHETRVSGKIKQVDYNGIVYSVSVPNEIILVERNGKPAWSGNSSFMETARGNVELVKTAFKTFHNPFKGTTYYSDPVFQHYRQAFLDSVSQTPSWLITISCSDGTLFSFDGSIKQMYFEDFLKYFDQPEMLEKHFLTEGGKNDAR